MKKIAVAVLTLLLATMCSTLQYRQKPEATVERYGIDKISFYDITLKFDIGIRNPYPVGLTLNDIKVRVDIEDKQLMNITTAEGLKVRAGKKEITGFDLNLKYEDIFRIVRDYSGRDYLDCLIDIEIQIPLPDVPGLEDSFSVKHSVVKKIPVIKPGISFENFKVDLPPLTEIASALRSKGGFSAIQIAEIAAGRRHLSLDDLKSLDLPLTIGFDLLVVNKAEAPLNFSNFRYDLFLGQEPFIKGDTSDIQNKDSSSRISIANTIRSGQITEGFIDFYNRKGGRFSINGEAAFELPREIQKDPVRFVFEESGDVRIR